MELWGFLCIFRDFDMDVIMIILISGYYGHSIMIIIGIYIMDCKWGDRGDHGIIMGYNPSLSLPSLIDGSVCSCKWHYSEILLDELMGKWD